MKEQILHIDNTNDIVGIILIHRKTSVHFSAKRLNELFVGGIYIYKNSYQCGGIMTSFAVESPKSTTL